MMAARDFKTGAVRIGDLIGVSQPDSGIFLPGPSRWYALRVAPQREMHAQIWLKKRGVYSFHPVLRRKAVRFGKAVEYQQRYLPGYVFARFKGDPVVHRVCSSPFILSALTYHGGAWGILNPSDLRGLHIMRQVDAPAGYGGGPGSARIADRVRQRRLCAMRAGEGALFTGGAFAGQHCEVVELTAEGGAKVRMRLFGGEVLVQARVDDLRAIPKSC